MPRGHKSKLRAREKRRQNRAEKQGDKSAQAPAGEEGEAACSSSSIWGDGPSTSTGAGTLQAPPSAPATTSADAGASGERSDVKAKGQVQKGKKASQASSSTGAGTLQAPQGATATTSADAGASGGRSAVKAKGQVQKGKKASQASTSAESSGQRLLSKKATMLVEYLLYQYKRNEPIRKRDMLKIIHKWFRKDFPEILRRASERMDLFFGLELKEVEPSGNTYTLVASQNESVGSGFRFPTKGLLMPVLGFILLNGNRVSEENTWVFLNTLGIIAGKTHLLFGEPRKLITQDLVQEKYLVYQPVPNSDPPRYEFLWGPRAHAETSKMKVLEFWAELNDTVPTTFQLHYEEALKDAEERARAQDAPKAATHPKATSRGKPQPE